MDIHTCSQTQKWVCQLNYSTDIFVVTDNIDGLVHVVSLQDIIMSSVTNIPWD
jgi:hypothetical protein